MKPRFVTIFQHLEPQHLGKDIAQIPYRMARSQGYDAKIVTVEHGEDLSQAKGSVGDLSITRIRPRGKIGSLDKAILHYIRNNAEKIDVLHLENFIRLNFFYGILYKWKNPKGQLYIKGDIYNHRLEERTVAQTRKAWKKPFIELLEKKFMSVFDLISLENQKALNIFRRVYPKHAHKALYLPNGIDEQLLGKEFYETTPWSDKENRFLVVGRIGHPFKNHGILLDALSKVNLKNWELRFIGAIDKDFQPSIDRFFEMHPEKQGSVNFPGPTFDQEKLFEEHRLAKVQLLPSKLESFGHVLLEGGAFDQYIIGSKGVLPFEEVTKDQSFGEALEEVNANILAERIQKIVDEPEAYRIAEGAFREHILEHFTWGKVVKDLHEALQERSAQR